MDQKRENASGGYGTRRVSAGRQSRGSVRRDMPEEKPSRQAKKKRKKIRLTRTEIRGAIVFLAALILAVILVFMTPLFNISEIRVDGNTVVELQTIKEKVGDVIGTNLFAIRSRRIEESLLEISQISNVNVKKKLIPPSLEITIEESIPAAYMLSGGSVIVVDTALVVIDDAGHYNTDTLPSVSGIGVPSYKLNERLTADSAEKADLLEELLYNLDRSKLLDRVTYISIDDITDIRFNYDNRLEVMCGSALELERKLRMFKESINSGSISENSIG
ncbi:MAG: FtsQ-type POTRA domain-containing protein, partial [Clostridia bacterium]|nr:FtsQ-type POTRA domain-containing protein [Clostridia bacterium]